VLEFVAVLGKVALFLGIVVAVGASACGLDAVGGREPDRGTAPAGSSAGPPAAGSGPPATGAPGSSSGDDGTISACNDGALAFAGNGQLATAPDDDALDLGGDFSVEVWVKPASTANGAEMDVVSHHDPYASRGWALLLLDGRFEIVVWGDDIGGRKAYSAGNSGPAYVVPGKWSHVVGTLSGDTLRIYYDGVLKDTQDFGLTFGRSSWRGALAFGRGAWAAQNAFAGEISEVRLSSSARYTGNTCARPNAPLANDASTVALWYFDETSGSAILDASGKGHDGSLAAATQAPARTQAPCVSAR
jgi:hypothetical protein